MTRRLPSSERPEKPRAKRSPASLLGWREWVALPDLGVERIKAKLDTGALTSALHVSELERFSRGKKSMVRFTIHPVQRRAEPVIECEAEVIAERRIRSSSGHAQLRPVIHTTLEVSGARATIEVGLVSRDQMGFRMLLGRRALRKRFHVSAGQSYLSDTPGRAPRRSASGKRKGKGKGKGKRERSS